MPSSRVVLNRAALDDFQLAVAAGLEALGRDVIARAAPNAPDDPSTSSRIADTGRYAVYSGSRKVAGEANKPRRLRTRKGSITVAMGFGHPLAHIFERGTTVRRTHSYADHAATGHSTGYIAARPFLLPALIATVHEMAPRVGAAIRARGLSRKPTT